MSDQHDPVAVRQALARLLRPLPPHSRVSVTRMVDDYTALFGGRAAALAALDHWLAEGAYPLAFLHAPAGRGKTALLLHWVAQMAVRDEWAVIFVPVSLRYGTATAPVALGALAAALAALHSDQATFAQTPPSPEQLRPLIAEYLARPLPDGRRLLVVLDGLDEAIGWQVGPDLLPPPVPHLYILAAARERPTAALADWLHRLGWLPSQVEPLTLAGLEAPAIAALLRQAGHPLAALADDADLLGQLARVSAGDPLTVRLLAAALRDGELTPAQLADLPPGLEGYLQDWLAALPAPGREATSALLALCAVALGPLQDIDLCALDPAHFPTPAEVAQAAALAARFVIGDGSPVSGYVLSHPRLRELLAERILPAQVRDQAQTRFLAYGAAWFAKRATPLPDYLRLFWATHLAEAGAWDDLRQVLTLMVPLGRGAQQPWAAARYAAEGSYAGYLSDLGQLWDHADATGDLVTGLHCALIAASLHGLSANLTPALLAGLVAVGTPAGRWSAWAALEHVRAMPHPRQQADCLLALLATGSGVSPESVLPLADALGELDVRARALAQVAAYLPPAEQPDVLQHALTAACALADDDKLAGALIGLAPQLPAALLPTALSAAQGLQKEAARAQALAALLAWLPPPEQQILRNEVLQIAAALNPSARAGVLVALVPHLPPAERATVAAEALDLIGGLNWPNHQFTLLSGLAAELPGQLLPDALAIARMLEDDDGRAELLAVLAPHLPAEQHQLVLEEALASAYRLVEPRDRAHTLALLAPQLSPALQRRVLDDAHALVGVLEWSRDRAYVLRELLPQLPASRLPDLLEQIRALDAAEDRVGLLAALAPRMPSTQQPRLYAEALIASQTLDDAHELANALGVLSQHVPPDQQHDLLRTALQLIITRCRSEERAGLLAILLPKLPADLLPAGLDAARSIDDADEQASVLEKLVPLLPPQLLPGVLDAAQTLEPYIRARLLAAVAAQLPDRLLPRVRRMAQAIDDPAQRANLLLALLPPAAGADRAELLAETLATIRVDIPSEHRAAQLLALLPHAAVADQAGLLVEALELSLTCDRVLTPLFLAPDPALLQPDTADALLELARAQPPRLGKAWVLAWLSQRWPAATRAAIFGEALAVARAQLDPAQLTQVLLAIQPQAPHECLPELLDMIAAVASDSLRSSLLHNLIPHLPVPLITPALTLARGLPDWMRVQALIRLAQRLPAQPQAKVLQEALKQAYAITQPWVSLQARIDVAHQLPSGAQGREFDALLQDIRAAEAGPMQIRVLSKLVEHLRPLERQRGYDALLELAAGQPTAEGQARVLLELLQHTAADTRQQLAEAVLPAVFEMVSAIRWGGLHMLILARLAPYVAGRPLADWQRLLRQVATQRRAELLAALAALEPWLAALTTPAQRSAIADLLLDVQQCWP